MAIANSGTLSLGDIQTEFGGTPPTEMEEYYRGGGVPDAPENQNVPTSGTISLSDYYGSSNITYQISLSFSTTEQSITVGTENLQQTFTTANDGVFTIPDYVNKVSVALVGGGGGGVGAMGNSSGNANGSGGSGGGGGGFAWRNDISVNPLNSNYSVSVGSGGSGGAFSTNSNTTGGRTLGNPGSATYFLGQTAGGGLGGGRGTYSNLGGPGGTFSGNGPSSERGGGSGGRGGFGYGGGGGGSGGFTGNGGGGGGQPAPTGSNAGGGGGSKTTTAPPFSSFGGRGGGTGVSFGGRDGQGGANAPSGFSNASPGGSGSFGLTGGGGGGGAMKAFFSNSNSTGYTGTGGAARIMYTGFNASTLNVSSGTLSIPSNAANRALPNSGADETATITKPGYTEGTVVTINVITTGVNDNTVLYWDVDWIQGTENNADITPSSSGTMTVTSAAASATFTLGLDYISESYEEVRVNLRTVSPTGTIVKQSDSFLIVNTSNPETIIPTLPSTITEGETLSFTVTTQGYSSGTNISWSVTGITAADLTSGSTSGTITHTESDNTIAQSHSLSWTFAEDYTASNENVENETFTFNISGATGTGQSVSILDKYYTMTLSMPSNKPFSQILQTTSGTYTVTVPTGATTMSAALIGGGGGGSIGRRSDSCGSGGGGGGMVWINDIPVTAGETIYYTVGAAGSKQNHNCSNYVSVSSPNAPITTSAFPVNCAATISGPSDGGTSSISMENSTTITVFAGNNSSITTSFSWNLKTLTGYSTISGVELVRVGAHGDLGATNEYIYVSWLPSAYQNIFETGGTDSGTTATWWTGSQNLISYFTAGSTLTLYFDPSDAVNFAPTGSSYWWYVELDIVVTGVGGAAGPIAEAFGGKAANFDLGGAGGGYSVGASYAQYPHGGATGKSGTDGGTGSSSRFPGGGGGAAGYYGSPNSTSNYDVGGGGSGGRGMFQMYRSDLGTIQISEVDGFDGAGTSTTTGVGATGVDGQDYPQDIYISGQADDGDLVTIYTSGNSSTTQATGGSGGVLQGSGAGGGGGGGGYMGSYNYTSGGSNYGYSYFAQSDGKQGYAGEVSIVFNDGITIYPKNKQNANIGTYILNEGDSFTVTWEHGPVSTSDTDFYWTLSPTPSANTDGVYDDFATSSGTVTILANQSSVTWTISSVLDYYPDGYETYSLYIYNSTQTVLLAQTDNITYLNSSDSDVTVSYSGGYPLINDKIYIAQGDSTTLTLAQQGTAGLDTGYDVEYRWTNLTDSSLINGTLGVTGNFTIGSSMSKTLSFNSGAVNNLYRWNTVLPVSDGLAFQVIPKSVSLVETNGTTQFYEGDTIYISYSSSGSFSSNTVPIEISGTGVTPTDFVSGVNAANGTYAYTHAIINATGGYQGQSGSIALVIAYDAFGEGDEIVTFSEPSGQSFSITIKESVYEVTSDTSTVNEDGSAITIDLTTLGVQSGESIDYRITGVSSADLNGASLTGNFSALTDTSRSYNITADLSLEGTETMVFEIGPSGTPYDSVSITINDTSVPTYSLTATSTAITEYNDTTITLTTTGLSNGTNVPYTITGVQAGDVTNSLTGNFTINSNTANVVIDPIFDNSIDGPETLTLSLDNGLDSIDITINEPTFSLSSSASTVTEGSSWTITLTTTGVPNGVTVPYTVSGISSDDLSSGSLTGNFTVNGNTATASFTASNDFATEGLENFILSCPSNHNPSVTVSIQDTSVPLYNLSRDDFSILVGETVTFSLQMTGLPNGTTVPYTISGTGVDSAKINGASLTGVFTSSSTSTNTDTVAVTHSFVLDNYASDRTLTITLDTPASNGEPIPSLSSSCTLAGSPITLSVASSNFEETGANNTIRWTIDSSGRLPNGTTIPFTLSGTGITASDFTLGSLTGNFSFSSGNGEGLFDLTASDDNTLEGTETVTLTTGTTPARSASKDLLDTSVPRIVWTNSTNEIWNETINVTFTAPGYADASYAYTISGSPPFTYSGTVSISSETGSIAITHAFDINDLSLSQRDYSLTIDADPDNSATTIRLLSNTISSSFSPSSTRNETTSTSGTWNLTTNRFPAGTTLPYQIIHHSGTTNNTDFDISNTGNITVGSLTGTQGSASLSFNILTDYVLEGTETKRFYIDLSASGSSDVNGFHYSELSILDTSVPNVDSMSASSSTISETGTSTITFTSVGLANGTTVNFDLAGTAYYNADFSLSGDITGVTSTGGTLTFNNNSATITITGIVNTDIQMFMTYQSGSTERIYVYNASQDLTTWSAGYVHTLPTPTGGFNTMNDLKFDNDGDRLFVLDNSKDRIFKWDLSTPYDITTATYSTAYFSHYTSHANPGVQGFWFSDTGTRLWTVDSNLDDIMEYTISAFTPDIENVAPGEVILISTSSPNMGNSRGIHVKPNGTKAFVLAANSDISGTFTDTIVEWSGNAWNDPNSWTYGNYFATGKTGHEGIFVDDNGNHVYISKDNEINYYYCTTGWDVTTMSFQRTVTVTGSGNEIQGLVMVDIPSDTVTITLPVQTNVIAEISSTVTINN